MSALPVARYGPEPIQPIVEHCGASLRGKAAATVVKPVTARLGHHALAAVTTPQQGLALVQRYKNLAQVGTHVDIFAGALRPLRGTYRRRVQLDGFHGEWLIGRGISAPDRAERVLIYFHGGAFMSCGLRTHRRLVSRLGVAAEAPAFSVAYRQLPKASIWQSVEDAITAYQYVLSRGVKPESIVLAGDSAGAHLSFSVALAARERGLPRPAAIVGISPWLDLDPTAKLASPYAKTEPLFPQSLFELQLTSGLFQDITDPAISPINADLTGLPPVFMQVGSVEIFRYDAEETAKRLGEAGVPTRLQIWEKQLHCFQVAADVLPEARRAIRDIGTFVRAAAPAAASPAAVNEVAS